MSRISASMWLRIRGLFRSRGAAADNRSPFLGAVVVTDHLVDDETKKLLAKRWVEPSLLREFPESFDLDLLAVGVRRGEADFRLVFSDALSDLESFCE